MFSSFSSIHTVVGIQVTSLMPLGGDGCTTLGSPVDINRDPKVKTALSGMTHITMVDRLTKSQFKDQGNHAEHNLIIYTSIFLLIYPLVN